LSWCGITVPNQLLKLDMLQQQVELAGVGWSWLLLAATMYWLRLLAAAHQQQPAAAASHVNFLFSRVPFLRPTILVLTRFSREKRLSNGRGR
jgi:hypothetical protein